MTKDEILKRIEVVFKKYCGVPPLVTKDLVPSTLLDGKLYEAHVLSLIVECLAMKEGFELTLVGGSKIEFKRGTGGINRKYPHIALNRLGSCVAELWTDVSFRTMSYARRGGPLTKGDYHEMDIIIVDPDQTGHAPYDTVWLAVECKNTGYQKGLLKEILGIRRELSLLSHAKPTRFNSWPRTSVPADPASCLLVYSTDVKALEYKAPGEVFGIDFCHEPM